MPADAGAASTRAAPAETPRYAWYVLLVLALVYLLNFLDRQILSILAESIKADIGVSDAQLGFLYGTAFAIFYAVFGIPLARLSDVWVRKNVIAIGLALWSAMTALSGTARGFLALGTYRIGVGIGEASATPAAYSMLSDSFPPERRATAFALYAAGLYVGQGVGYFIGGWILDSWDAAFPGGQGWLGLRGWQAAFMAVGLPGLAVALWMWTLREPERGRWETAPPPPAESRPGRMLLRELAAVIPPLTLWSLRREGASAGLLARNAAIVLALGVAVAGLVAVLGGPEQWIALAIGVYATLSWAQGIRLRDPVAHRLLFRCPSLALVIGCASLASLVVYAFSFWSAPFLLRAHGVTATEAGLALMVASALGGGLGVALGGVLSDRRRQHSAVGRVQVLVLSVAAMLPAGLGMLYASSASGAYAMAFVYQMTATMWVSSSTALVTELVLPRMRAIATALALLMFTFVGLALGPFAVGRISDALMASDSAPDAALRTAMAASLLVLIPAVGLGAAALRTVPPDERSVWERARAAGEPTGARG